MAWSRLERKRSNSVRVRCPIKRAKVITPRTPTSRKARVSFPAKEPMIARKPPSDLLSRELGGDLLPKTVAHSINCFDIFGVLRVTFNLAAQVADMHINRAFIALIGIAR